MSPYILILLAVCALVTYLFFTGHRKLALGITAGALLSIVVFYMTVIYALRKWSNGGK